MFLLFSDSEQEQETIDFVIITNDFYVSAKLSTFSHNMGINCVDNQIYPHFRDLKVPPFYDKLTRARG